MRFLPLGALASRTPSDDPIEFCSPPAMEPGSRQAWFRFLAMLDDRPELAPPLPVLLQRLGTDASRWRSGQIRRAIWQSLAGRPLLNKHKRWNLRRWGWVAPPRLLRVRIKLDRRRPNTRKFRKGKL